MPTNTLGIDSEEDITSTHDGGDESEVDFMEEPQSKIKGKRKANKIKEPTKKRAKIGVTKTKDTDSRTNVGGAKTFTVEGLLSAFPQTTEYGQTLRTMGEDEQKLEVIRLNKGAASGMKVAIKKKRIASCTTLQ